MNLTIEIYKGDIKARQTMQINHPAGSPMYVAVSPFGNCQTFTVTYAYYFLSYDQVQIKEFLDKMIYISDGKTQMVIDVEADKSDRIIEKLKPFFNNIISTPYVSTNGSKMVMHIIQLDRDVFELDK